MREVLILISKKELRARILLIVVCLAVGLYCLYSMDKSYDPLARYPYTTDENRDVLLKYLDSADFAIPTRLANSLIDKFFSSLN